VLGGSDANAFTVAHMLRDGVRFDVGALPVDDDVDLAVVGAGLGGLSAALFFRQRHPHARVIILDSHDVIGGHALRVELPAFGRTLLAYGGSESIQSPGEWSRSSLALLQALDVDLPALAKGFHTTLYPGLGLSRGVFFHKEAFGEDKLVTGDPTRMVADDIPRGQTRAKSVEAFVRDMPLPAESRAKIAAVYGERRDVLAHVPPARQERALRTMSYRAFLQTCWGLDDTAALAFQNRPHDYYAIGSDGLPAYDAMEMGLPGFQGLRVSSSSLAEAELDDPYVHHFPDGNASLARLLVRKLVPDALPGARWDDVVLAALDPSRLDAGHDVRVRLRSTVVSARNTKDGAVDVGYVHDGALRRLRSRRMIFAGYAAMAPYVLPELSSHEAQKLALSSSVRAPLVYVKVAIRNWASWVARGVHEIFSPTGFFARTKLDYPVSLGCYRFPTSPTEPIGLHLVHVPTPANTGADQRTAWRMGRAMLLGMCFSDFETKVKDELARMLGPGGFDVERDISAIVVCRWGHGYAYNFNSLYDDDNARAAPKVASRRLGRIVLAGSDAGWSAYANGAFDEAWRAVQELG
jgi:spermidine dehydrogenase